MVTGVSTNANSQSFLNSPCNRISSVALMAIGLTGIAALQVKDLKTQQKLIQAIWLTTAAYVVMDMIFSGILSLDDLGRASSNYRHTTHTHHYHYNDGHRTTYYPNPRPYRSGKPPAPGQTETVSRDKGRRGANGNGTTCNTHPPKVNAGGSNDKPPSSRQTETVSRDRGRRK